MLRHRIQRPLVLDSPANTLILQALNDAGSVPPDLDKDEVLETLRDALGFDSGLLCAGGLMRASVNSEDPEGQPVKVFIADFVDQKKALGAIGTTIKVDQVSLALQGRLQPHHHTFLCNEMPLHNDGACGNDTIRGLLATFPQSTQLCVKLAPSAAAFSRFGLLMVKISSPAPIDRFSFDVKVEGQPRVVYFRPLRETAASSCVVCLSHQHSTAACPLFTTLLVELPQGLHPRLVQEL